MLASLSNLDKMFENLLRVFSLSLLPILVMASLLFFQQRQQRIDEVLINGGWKQGQDDPRFHWYHNKTRYQIVGIDNEGWQSRANCHKSWSFEGQKYIWTPKNKTIISMPKKSLCDIISGRDVIVVGDSMSAQFFMTFLLIIWPWPEGKSFYDYYKFPRSNFKSYSTYRIPCLLPFKVSFVRNIYLSFNRNDRIYMLNRSELNMPPKKVVIINSVMTQITLEYSQKHYLILFPRNMLSLSPSTRWLIHGFKL